MYDVRGILRILKIIIVFTAMFTALCSGAQPAPHATEPSTTLVSMPPPDGGVLVEPRAKQ